MKVFHIFFLGYPLITWCKQNFTCGSTIRPKSQGLGYKQNSYPHSLIRFPSLSPFLLSSLDFFISLSLIRFATSLFPSSFTIFCILILSFFSMFHQSFQSLCIFDIFSFCFAANICFLFFHSHIFVLLLICFCLDNFIEMITDWERGIFPSKKINKYIFFRI